MSTITEPDECEIFINEVKLRPQLWDKGNRDYNNHWIAKEKWQEISTKFDVPEESVKKKWNMLRIQFRRELRKQISHRTLDKGIQLIQPWKYFLAMLFMKGQVNFMKPISSVNNRELKINWEEKTPDIDQIMKELQDLEDTYKQPLYEEIPSGPSFVKQPKQSLNVGGDRTSLLCQPSSSSSNPSLCSLIENFQKEIINLEKEKLEQMSMVNSDDDMLFLHSILPYFKALNAKQKFALRTKIQQLVCNFIVNDGHMTEHSYARNSS